MSSDIVIDTLDTLIGLLREQPGAAPVDLQAVRGQAERIVRGAWGGERVYVAKLGEDGQRQLSARDRQIRRDFGRGDHVALLARRYGLSPQRVRAIVQSERGAAAALADCLTGERADAQHPAHAADRASGRTRPRHRGRHGDVDPQPS